MMILLLVQFAAALCAPLLVRLLGRNAFLVLALVPASFVVWAAIQGPAAWDHETIVAIPWISALDLNLVFRMNSLSWLMIMIVGGVGAVVLVYSSRYFAADAHGLTRFATFFMAFAAAMFGVVLADQTMIM